MRIIHRHAVVLTHGWGHKQILPRLRSEPQKFAGDLKAQIQNFIAIEADLTKDKKFTLRSFVQDIYDNEPAPGRKKNDLKWVTAIAYKF